MVEIIGGVVGVAIGLLWAVSNTKAERKAARRVSWEAFKALSRLGN
jgi:gas vesicle protein